MSRLQITVERCQRLAIIGQLLQTSDHICERETMIRRMQRADLISQTSAELLLEYYCEGIPL